MIRGLMGVALFVLGIHVANIFVSPQIRNTMLQGKMEEVSKNRTLRSDKDVRRVMMEFIEEKKIPLAADQLVITANDKQTTIAAHYTVNAKFWFYEREYEYYPASSADARLRPARQLKNQTSRRTANAGR